MELHTITSCTSNKTKLEGFDQNCYKLYEEKDQSSCSMICFKFHHLYIYTVLLRPQLLCDMENDFIPIKDNYLPQAKAGADFQAAI